MCALNIKTESNIHSKLHLQLQPIPVSFRVLLYPTYYCNRIRQQYNGLWFPQCEVLLVSTTLFVGICWPFYIIGSLNDSIVSNLSRTKNKIEEVCRLTLKYCFAFNADSSRCGFESNKKSVALSSMEQRSGNWL